MPKSVRPHVAADLYIAASIEGYIADEYGGTAWVADEDLFEQTCRAYGCICMGHTTYKEYGGPAFEGVQHIVLARTPPKKVPDGVHFVASVEDALATAHKLGFKKLLVIGGAKTNQAFMQADVVRKVFTDIHPILLKKGLPMFGDYTANFDFKMTKNKWYNDGFMHAEYTVGKVHPSEAVVVIRDGAGNYFMHARTADAQPQTPGPWRIGVAAKVGELETPLAVATRVLREHTGIKRAPNFCFKVDDASTEPATVCHVFEVTVRKPKEYKGVGLWDETAWLSAEHINGLVADGKCTPEAVRIFQAYRSNLNG